MACVSYVFDDKPSYYKKYIYIQDFLISHFLNENEFLCSLKTLMVEIIKRFTLSRKYLYADIKNSCQFTQEVTTTPLEAQISSESPLSPPFTQLIIKGTVKRGNKHKENIVPLRSMSLLVPLRSMILILRMHCLRRLQEAEANVTVNNILSLDTLSTKLRPQALLSHCVEEEMPTLTEPYCKMNWRIFLFLLTELFRSVTRPS